MPCSRCCTRDRRFLPFARASSCDEIPRHPKHGLAVGHRQNSRTCAHSAPTLSLFAYALGGKMRAIISALGLAALSVLRFVSPGSDQKTEEGLIAAWEHEQKSD